MGHEVYNDECLLLLDFFNAYNTVNRQLMIDNIGALRPYFFSCEWFCYRPPTMLQADGFRVMSSQGMQQESLPVDILGISRIPTDKGVKVLGSPVGSSAFIDVL